MQFQPSTADRADRRLPAEPTRATATLDERACDLLAERRIAVSGIWATREPAGNVIYRKLKAAGHKFLVLHSSRSAFDGDPCHPDVSSIPGGIDGVVIVNRPEVTESIVRQCPDAGVSRVWIHQST